MRIRFAFTIKQINENTIEIKEHDFGEKMMPSLTLNNASGLMKEYKLSDRQLDEIGREAHEAAATQLVRETISVTFE